MPTMTKQTEVWTSQRRWRDRWAVVERLQGGGQGNAWRVCRKGDDRDGFLKAIRAKRDPERRARFSREANTYATVTVRGIPRLIESNAHLWKDAAVEPYMVTEFIEGPTLRRWRESRDQVSLRDSIGVTQKLLAILNACHDVGLVHRDVKPDNIILVDGGPKQPVLLDFGLSFRRGSEIDFETEEGQEIGNRFLRLPELAAGSPLKQDVRSDLSFAAGILYYLLSGQHPDIVQDAEGRLPHQRDKPLAMLQEVAGARLPRLLSLFDKAFAPRIAERFVSADEMLADMEGVMAPRGRARSEESRIEAIRETMDTEAARRTAQTHTRLVEAHGHIARVFDDVTRNLRERERVSVGGVLHGAPSVANPQRTLSWKAQGTDETVLSVTFNVREAGDELVIDLSEQPVYRTSLASPHYGDRFDDAIRDVLIARLHEAVTDRS